MKHGKQNRRRKAKGKAEPAKSGDSKSAGGLARKKRLRRLTERVLAGKTDYPLTNRAVEAQDDWVNSTMPRKHTTDALKMLAHIAGSDPKRQQSFLDEVANREIASRIYP